MLKELIAEGVGTFLLVFSIAVSRSEAFAVGATLWSAMIYTGFISGAQFNPAITFAIMLRKIYLKRLTIPILIHLAFNIFIQIISSIVAALIAWSIIRYPVYFDIRDGYQIGEGFAAEMIYTGIICAVALMAGHIKESVVYAGGMVALSVTASNWAVGRITGGCFNPAAAIGVNLVYYAKNGEHLSIIWLYILAPLLGSILGAFFATIFLDEIEAQCKKDQSPSINEPLKE